MEFGIGAGPGLVREATVTVLLGVQPGKRRWRCDRCVPVALSAMSTIAVELVSLVSKLVAPLGSSLMSR